jgi:site-specific DNA-methyltransferase (adenine-specific)
MNALLNKITQGDCLDISSKIESGSVDLILTDLPYGNMRGAGLDGWSKDATGWDFAIEPKKIYDIANRVLRKNGKMVLFSQEPYTSRLINECIPNIPFSYRMIWEKDHFANSLIAKKAPVSYYEDILIFSKTHDTEAIHPLRLYFKEVLNFIGLNLKQINAKLGHRREEHSFYVNPKKAIASEIGQKADHVFRVGSTQFSLCTDNTYKELIDVFGIDNMDGFKEFKELKAIDEQFKKDLPSTFNLWEGKKYKSNILKYKKDYDGFHPTQKPVAILEDVIKTFSNEGDLVVDLTCGSASTCVAAINTNRQFIGIEREQEYVEIGNRRIEEALKRKEDK